jgi:hypothetical protein
LAKSKGREVFNFDTEANALQTSENIIDICHNDGELFKEDVYVTGVGSDHIRISGESNGYFAHHYRIFKRTRP